MSANPLPQQADYEGLRNYIRAWMARFYPGIPFEYAQIFSSKLPIPINVVEHPALGVPFPHMPAGTSSVLPEPPSNGQAKEEGDGWEPNDYQCRILESLEFRALRSDALVDEIGGDRRRLWKDRGIKELVDRGLVKLDREKRLGYFRPDAPPDELA